MESLNTNQFKPADPDFEARVRLGFDRQRVMKTLGAEITKLAPGEVHIAFRFHPDFTQQDGFMHAGIITTVVDSACGFAAYTLMPAEARVLSVEFKINLMSPAIGEKFLAIGKVKKAGRTLTVCSGEVFAFTPDGRQKSIAAMQATMMTILS